MSYKVRPARLKVVIGEWTKSFLSLGNIGCSGCTSLVGAFIFLIWAQNKAMLAVGEDFQRWLSILAAVAALIYCLVTFALYMIRKLKRNRSEAKQLTGQASEILDGVKSHSEHLRYWANSAAGKLHQAKKDFQEEVFSPFWDAIESAAGDLGECHKSCEWISTNVDRYDIALRGREHSFPDCLEGIEQLPDCQPLLEEFYRLVHQAQRDFRFANIWEHRQTRKVLIMGFSTLGEAIRNLETTVARSIADLRKTVEERNLFAAPTTAGARKVLNFFVPGL